MRHGFRALRHLSFPFYNLLIGSVIALTHGAWVLLISAPSSLAAKLLALTQWDGNWFCSILENGYINHTPINPNDVNSVNVAFFPGYPLLAKALAGVFSLSNRMALLAASLVAAAAFWTLLLSLTTRWSAERRWWVVAGCLAFPTSFYLVAAYSEGLFLACTLGFALSYLRPAKSQAWYLARTGLLGAAMGFTRVVGIPLTAVPWIRRTTSTSLVAWIPVLSLMGPTAYFAFCWIRFGEPFLPLQAHHDGWGVRPTFGALWSSRLWQTDFSFSWFNLEAHKLDIAVFSIFLTSLFAWILLLTSAWQLFALYRKRAEPRASQEAHEALFYLLLAGVLFVLPVLSFYELWFFALPRYLFPVAVFVLCAWGAGDHGLRNEGRGDRADNRESEDDRESADAALKQWIFRLLAFIALACSLWLQGLLILRFTSMQWVA